MQRIGKNIFSLGGARVLSGLITFFVYILLTNYLGRNGFGQYSLVLAYYLIFSLLVDLGVARYVIKRVSENQPEAGILTGNFFVVQLFLSCFVVLVFAVLPRLAGYEVEISRAMLVAGLGLFINSLASPFSAVLQARERIQVVAGVTFFSSLVNTIWMGLAIVFHLDLVFLFASYAVTGVLNIMAYYWYFRQDEKLIFSLDLRLMRTMLMYGLPFAFISGFEMVIAKIDVVIQNFFLSYDQIGIYSAAYKLVDILTFIPAIIYISLFPYIARQTTMDSPEVRHTVSELNRYLVALALPIGVGGSLLARRIILSIYSSEFVGSVVILQILVWASVLTFIYAVPNIIMIVKQVRRSIYILLSIMVFNAVANLFFVPRFGILASAWITVVSYLIYATAYTKFARSLLTFPLLRFVPWPFISSVVMGVGIYFFRDLPLPVLIAGSAMVYVGILSAVGFLHKGDWLFLKSIFAKNA